MSQLHKRFNDEQISVLFQSYCQGHLSRADFQGMLGIGASFLANNDPEEISERVKHYVEIGGENGRFALYLCNLGATTPPENVKAAIESARAFDHYD